MKASNFSMFIVLIGLTLSAYLTPAAAPVAAPLWEPNGIADSIRNFNDLMKQARELGSNAKEAIKKLDEAQAELNKIQTKASPKVEGDIPLVVFLTENNFMNKISADMLNVKENLLGRISELISQISSQKLALRTPLPPPLLPPTPPVVPPGPIVAPKSQIEQIHSTMDLVKQMEKIELPRLPDTDTGKRLAEDFVNRFNHVIDACKDFLNTVFAKSTPGKDLDQLDMALVNQIQSEVNKLLKSANDARRGAQAERVIFVKDFLSFEKFVNNQIKLHT